MQAHNPLLSGASERGCCSVVINHPMVVIGEPLKPDSTSETSEGLGSWPRAVRTVDYRQNGNGKTADRKALDIFIGEAIWPNLLDEALRSRTAKGGCQDQTDSRMGRRCLESAPVQSRRC